MNRMDHVVFKQVKKDRHHSSHKHSSSSSKHHSSSSKHHSSSSSSSKDPSKHHSSSSSKDPSKHHSSSSSKDPSKHHSSSSSKDPSKHHSSSSSKDPSKHHSSSSSKHSSSSSSSKHHSSSSSSSKDKHGSSSSSSKHSSSSSKDPSKHSSSSSKDPSKHSSSSHKHGSSSSSQDPVKHSSSSSSKHSSSKHSSSSGSSKHSSSHSSSHKHKDGSSKHHSSSSSKHHSSSSSHRPKESPAPSDAAKFSAANSMGPPPVAPKPPKLSIKFESPVKNELKQEIKVERFSPQKMAELSMSPTKELSGKVKEERMEVDSDDDAPLVSVWHVCTYMMYSLAVAWISTLPVLPGILFWEKLVVSTLVYLQTECTQGGSKKDEGPEALPGSVWWWRRCSVDCQVGVRLRFFMVHSHCVLWGMRWEWCLSPSLLKWCALVFSQLYKIGQ